MALKALLDQREELKKAPPGIMFGMQACCDDKRFRTKYEKADCFVCQNWWHIECVGPGAYDAAELSVEEMEEMKKGSGKKLKDWICPRCCWVGNQRMLSEKLLDQDEAKQARRQKRHWKCDWPGCTEEGFGGAPMKKVHIERDHEGIRHQCPRCPDDFSTEGALKRHLKNCKSVTAVVTNLPLTVNAAPIVGLLMEK